MFCCLLFFGRSFVCCMFLLVILTQSRRPSDGTMISVFFFVENKSDRGSAGEFLKILQHTSLKQTVYTTVRILSTAYQWLCNNMNIIIILLLFFLHCEKMHRPVPECDIHVLYIFTIWLNSVLKIENGVYNTTYLTQGFSF